MARDDNSEFGAGLLGPGIVYTDELKRRLRASLAGRSAYPAGTEYFAHMVAEPNVDVAQCVRDVWAERHEGPPAFEASDAVFC